MKMADNIIEVSGLKKNFKYGKKQLKAVDDLSFTIERGTTMGLVGESGSGKSTVARLILKLIEPTAGKVLFNGYSIYDMPKTKLKETRKNMQIIFQNPYSSLFPQFSIGQNIEEPFIINGVEKQVGKKDYMDKVLELMNLVGVPTEYYSAFPHELSGGQQQRVGIARALALNPEFVVCDEPVSSLDVSIQAQILNLLQDLQEKRNLSYIFIAHNLAVVEHISQKVAVMYLGKIVESAETHELFNHPVHPYTKALLEAVPVVTSQRDKEFKIINGEIPSPLDPPKGCSFCTRCPIAADRCRKTAPEYKEIGTGHFAACHLLKFTLMKGGIL
jgi:oligopeptide/dipeptide ABC transporter ATP-binding protein